MQILFGVEFCFALSREAARTEGEHPGCTLDSLPPTMAAAGVARRGEEHNQRDVDRPAARRDYPPGLRKRAAAVWICPAPAGAAGAGITGASILPVWELRLPAEDNWAVNLWLQASASGPVAPLAPELVARVARYEAEDMPWEHR